ncbi:hypothetical protein Q4575_19720, partial [Psychrosphaera sp. 1_MG-2023]|uniref:hypothetical protein n=1 Tax=Psychrosphaera sp. 1_MG-2023 TaxID=3062643 RepID=UPI0026E1E8EA
GFVTVCSVPLRFTFKQTVTHRLRRRYVYKEVMRIFFSFVLVVFSLTSIASDIDKNLIYGQWKQVNPNDNACPFSVYEYLEDSTMLSANVFCGGAGAVAVNYRTKWEFTENNKLKDKLIYVDEIAKNWFTSEQMQNEYLIRELTGNKMILVNTKSKETFNYTRLK